MALILGFIIGQNVSPIEKIKLVKEQVVDTVYKSKVVKVEVEKPVKSIDTVFIVTENTEKEDSVEISDNTETVEEDELLESDTLQIKQDEKLKSELLSLTILKDEKKDTLREKLLGVESVKQTQINVEYWESPLNYIGYKLSKSKLIVYGIVPLKTSKIYKIDLNYYFKVNDLYYELQETADFKKMITISKPTIIND